MFMSAASAVQRISRQSSSYLPRSVHTFSNRNSMATSSFAGQMNSYPASGSTLMTGSSLGSTLSSTFQGVSSLLNRPRVHQMQSRCTSDDVMGLSPTSPILYGIVQKALICNPANGSTVGFTNCLDNSFPDLAPSEECYNCIVQFVDLNKLNCDPNSHACIKQTAADLWAVCSP